MSREIWLRLQLVVATGTGVTEGNLQNHTSYIEEEEGMTFIQVMETIISLGYILSHYNQKGGANVCIVLGK
jgi:hypothetical protein